MKNMEVTIKNLIIKIEVKSKEFIKEANNDDIFKDDMFKKYEDKNQIDLKKKISYIILTFMLSMLLIFLFLGSWMGALFFSILFIISGVWCGYVHTLRYHFDENYDNFCLEEFCKKRVEQSFLQDNIDELSSITNIDFFKNYTYKNMYFYLESLLPTK